VYYKLLQKEL